MATSTFYATKDFRYGTRMMRAGDEVEMTAPNARLYRALGAIADKKPRAKPVTEEVVQPKPKRKTTRKRTKKSA